MANKLNIGDLVGIDLDRIALILRDHAKNSITIYSNFDKVGVRFTGEMAEIIWKEWTYAATTCLLTRPLTPPPTKSEDKKDEV
jgi:hypothetical protein